MLLLFWVSALTGLASAVPTSYDTCKPLPTGHGPKAKPDTVEEFYALSALKTLSSSTHTPEGYSRVFQGEKGSVSASNYLGSYILTSYSAETCAPLCNTKKGCEGFNMSVSASFINLPT
ncbi:uncharacterized protein BDZ99DRAFT_298083 [Mytilinidion resinicola]|uniref:Apple domain-containing protein n=1 Tax=Mytilinidion resinicola TaxID=574789 RepID=A0A6A6YT68_9PEZI|nr:uncharacterized protein BDZ99DRAFT_298083 [Mytilinidion resinicola]KAF2811224.1 hypothetical protein BDZ99DRAFT_298083 [Mytilinidion resinicola]